MSSLSPASMDRRDPRRDPNSHDATAEFDTDRLAGSPPPAIAAPHEGLVGEPDVPLGDDPRPGNQGHSAEAPAAEDHGDALDEASDESFPASDPPSWSTAPTVGEERPDPPSAPPRHGLGRVVAGDSTEQGPPGARAGA